MHSIPISKVDVELQLATLEKCISSVYQWLLHNGLSLLLSKADAIQFITGRKQSGAVDRATVRVSGVAIQPVETIRNLGVMLDRRLSMDQHIKNVCKACHLHIRVMRYARGSLPDDVAKTVVCSSVSSQLDNCYALYTGMSSANYLKLQRVQYIDLYCSQTVQA
jgi:hypothetical protein